MDVYQVSQVLGVPVQAVKLLFTVFAVNLLAIVHYLIIYKYKPLVQHLFFILTSSCLYYWNYGLDIYHAYICIFAQWIFFIVLGGSLNSVITSFAFHLSYLVWGYFAYSTDDYDINWLMPHCILTLRLIGLAFDVFDGHREEKFVTKEQQDRKIVDIPSLLEISSFSFFPAGFLVGPQFPLVKVRALVHGTLVDSTVLSRKRYKAAFSRIFAGVTFLLIQTYISNFFYTDFYFTKQFKDMSFVRRACYVTLTGYNILLRYITVWMINEGSCIIFGIGYRKDPINGKDQWDAVRNGKLREFLFCKSFHGLIECFNINTNDWVARYVFKRLKFLGNKSLSHVTTLLFLAIWHGVHVGYFTCFMFEFLVINAEKSTLHFLKSSGLLQMIKSSSLLNLVSDIIGFIYFHIFSGYVIIDFTLLKWNRYKPVYDLILWNGHIVFLLLLVLSKTFQQFVNTKKEA